VKPRNANGHSILREIGKGERIALSKLAVEHLERTGRPFRIAVDVAIWQFQNQAGQGGANPALRTLYYRLLKLLALPIHPIFVYDGKNKPLTKRNKTVTAYGTCLPNEMSKKLIHAFRFPYHTAPGEAEAECALLQRKGIVDAVMSQDVDTLMFGSLMTLRDWSKEGTKGNNTASHVNVLRAEETRTKTGLDPDGMILVALLSGGDYSTEGVPGFGPSLACEIAQARFGTDLLQLLREGDTNGVKEWRERLQYELETNESGYFKKRHRTVRIPENFPDSAIVGYYTDPAVSSLEQLQKISLKCAETWDTDIDILALRVYVAEKFEWLYKAGAKKLIRTLAPSLLANHLRRGLNSTTITSCESIKERRIQFVNDGLPELRLEVIPNDIVRLNMEDEEERPAYTEQVAIVDKDVAVYVDEVIDRDVEDTEDLSAPPSPSKRRRRPPWDPAAPQKIWVPETITKLGIAALVEAWEQKQRDILADPKKFATRNCQKSKPRTKAKNTGMKPGALDRYFTSSKPGVTRDPQIGDVSQSKARNGQRDPTSEGASTAPRRPSKTASKSQMEGSSPTLARYFNRSPLPPIAGLDRRKDGTAGIEIPPRARYSALGLYGSEALSTDGEESFEIHGSLSHKAAAVSTTGKDSIQGSGAGALPNEPIVILSSPLPTPAATPPLALTSLSDQVPQLVTQRTKRRPREAHLPAAHITNTIPDNTSPPAAQVPIVHAAKTMKGHFPTRKAIVLSRESLPGTWKEANDEKVVLFGAGTQHRRLPRVSILDLTNS
jgi:Holliday junction resolvase YEN1